MRKLYTKEGEDLPEIPWNDYPRPQMQREEWLCLNGEWKFSVPGWLPRRICVPFCPEFLLSGIQVPPEIGAEMVYEREFELPEMWKGKHILLHFGAVCRECRVAGKH